MGREAKVVQRFLNGQLPPSRVPSSFLLAAIRERQPNPNDDGLWI
jgi:hypothetical protein